MSVPRLRVPFKLPAAQEPDPTLRKASIRAFGGRLQLVDWLTMPADPFLQVTGHGLALYPLTPHVRWYWDMPGFGLYQSDPLVFVGFPPGELPHPLT
jgi:hypothetical protein